MNKAIFLDRDGTINVDVDYLHECDQLVFLKGAVKALRILQDKGFKLLVITNQSGVGRGYFSMDEVEKVHAYMRALLLKEGVFIDGFYCCPHVEQDHCQCRKPQPFLYRKAAREHQIDLTKSYMVGDKVTDILAAEELHCNYGMVLSGHSIDEKIQEKYSGHIYKDLLEFAEAVERQEE